MAGDWLKVEKATPDKPEIGHIARTCQVSVGEAFAAWFRLWCYLDGETADGEVQFMTNDDADRVARLPGIGQALSEVHWLVFHGSGTTVVGWDKHNGASAKQRAETNRRVARWRTKRGM